MQHLIFGAGLVGGYLAGVMQHNGLQVRLLARESMRAKFSTGLRISDYLGNEASLPGPDFIDQHAAAGKFDVIWLTVKCTAVADTLVELERFVHEHSTIICCQNGLGSDALVREHFANNQVLQCLVGFNVVEADPGHLCRSTEGTLVLQDCSLVQELEPDLKSDLLPLRISQDICAEQWAKLQLNLTNPVNALANIPLKSMLEQRPYRTLVADLMLELLDVSRRLGLILPRLTALPARAIPYMLKMPDWMFSIVGQKMLAIDPTAHLSMWWDLTQGKKTEIDYLNAAVARIGAEQGVECELNESIAALIKQVENGSISIGMSAADIRTGSTAA